MAIFLVFLSLSAVQLSTNAQATEGISCLEGDIRLRDGVSNSTGRVEICYNNAWGIVCGDGWSGSNAEVACRQLGFAGYRTVLTSRDVVDGSGQIVLSYFSCTGNESRLLNCSHLGLRLRYCYSYAGVSCFEACERDNVSIRLVAGPSEYEGLIELCTNNTNNSVGDPNVCDSSWTLADATVVCRQLGYSTLGAVPRMENHFSRFRFRYNYQHSRIPALLGDVVCIGSESQLVDCQHPGLGNQSCSTSRYVGVSCHPPGTEPMCTDGDIRLVNSDGTSTEVSEGRLQFCYDSVWGAVYSNNFDIAAATVVCRELGIANAGTPTSYGSTLGLVYGVVALDSTGCTGREDRFSQCSACPIEDITLSRSYSNEAGARCLTGILLVQKLSGGEIFAILFCLFLFVGSIIVLILGLAYYKQRQYKKLVRTHSSSDSSSDRHPPTASETAQRVEQVGVATPVDPTPNQDSTHNGSDPPPPAYCEPTSEQCHTETDHPEQGLI